MHGAWNEGMARAAIGVWMLACLTAPLQATTLERLSLEDMALKSTAIVHGRAVGAQAVATKTLIYTHYKIQVLESWKGSNGAVLDVAVPGGVINGQRQTIAGAPELTEGADYLLFLWTGKSGLTHIIGLSQGAMILTKDSTGNLMVGRAASGELMLNPSGKPAADSAVLMRLNDMRDRVSRALAGGAR